MGVCITAVCALAGDLLSLQSLAFDTVRWVPFQIVDDPALLSRVARIACGLNVLLLVGLGYIWARNYAQFRSKHTLGLLVFSLLLLAENALALYYYTLDPTLSAWFASEAVPAIAWEAMMLLHALETIALLFLAWATWD